MAQDQTHAGGHEGQLNFVIMEAVMQLDEALNILARVHTRDDSRAGFTVQAPSLPPYVDISSYVEAWTAVRMHLRMNVNPEPIEQN